MPEGQAGAVKELPLEAEASAAPVAGVPCDGMADRGQVDTDLVRSPGLQPDLEQRGSGQALEDREVGSRLAPAPAADGALLRRAVVAPERRVDRARARARVALDQRQIGALHLAGLDDRGEAPVSLWVARDDHEARGVLVESVHDSRPGVLTTAQKISQEVDERRAADARRGMDHEPGRLVDHGQALVDVHQVDTALVHGRPRSGARAISTSATAPAVIATSA